LAASGPVSAMPKPILIGSAALAGSAAISTIAAAVTSQCRAANPNNRIFADISTPLLILSFDDIDQSIIRALI
jgi:hypothetical protein